MCAFNPEEYRELLRILAKVSRITGAGIEEPTEQDLASEALAAKFSYHAFSALFLYEHQTELTNFFAGMGTTADVRFTDMASIHVLGRAAIESVLVFNHTQ